MPTIKGNIESAVNESGIEESGILGSVDVQLCGYGSQVPRANGEALVGKLTQTVDAAAGTGLFTFTVHGNDQISPDGTYYTVTVRNENGDIAQVNAYRFLASTASYDLNLLDPYDPNQPPPPLPPLITNQLLILPWSDPMEFPGDEYTAFRFTLTGDVTSSDLTNTVQGNLYTFIIQQDAIGNHQFAWPSLLINPSPINPTPLGFTVQTFVRGQYSLAPIGSATWVQP